MAKDERNFIKRNGKIYYKTDVDYVYQCEDKTYAYENIDDFINAIEKIQN